MASLSEIPQICKTSIPGVLVDLVDQSLLVNGKTIEIKGNLFKLFWIFHQNLNEIVDADTLSNNALGGEYTEQSNRLEVTIFALRKKLKGIGHIKTFRGKGYCLKPTDETERSVYA